MKDSEAYKLQLKEFAASEQEARDGILLRTAYMDVAPSLNAAVLLAQLVCWHGVSEKDGRLRLRVERDGYVWLAKMHDEWWCEIRLTATQVRRAMKQLEELGVVETRAWMFGGLRTLHIRLVPEVLMPLIEEAQTAQELLRKETQSIVYWPLLQRVAGSVTAAILLQQIFHWHEVAGGQPFYKFRDECDHELYRPGDSWMEELAFSRTEFETARNKIATKVKRGTSKTQARENSLVIYWTDSERLTWYDVNHELLLERLTEAVEEVEKVEEMEASILVRDPHLRQRTQSAMTRDRLLPHTTKKHTSRFGYVYLLEGDGCHKIGRAKDPTKRTEQLAVQLPYEVNLVCAIASADYAKLEAELHNHFAEKRLNGEWFDLSQEDVNAFKWLAQEFEASLLA
jgi:hypothetical protein